MQFIKSCVTGAVFGAMLVSGQAIAKVSADEAAKLKTTLMPLGGEKAGNADGTIPAWDGGFYKDIPDGQRVTNPFPDDKPLFTITNDNKDEYKDKLSAGQMAMLSNFTASYKIPVYKTRRTAAAPDFVYEATLKNATTAELKNDGEALSGAVTGIPFPIPQNGKEVIWNHKARYRGLSVTRWNNQAAVQTNGKFSLYKLLEDVRFHYNYPNQTPADLNNVLVYFMQRTMAPPRQAGAILLVHDTVDQISEPRRAWLYNPGQRRLRRAPNVAYDNPGTGADGLRTNDQLDSFNGASDRYTWKLAGKKEMYVPYNSYDLHSDKNSYDDIIGPGHIDQSMSRYELHRVWVVEAELNAGTSHIYKKRTFFVDEDSWTILLSDIYDKRDQLWRFQEAHIMNFYDEPAMGAAISTIYDLQSGRYLTMDMNNEDDETARKDFSADYFSTSNVKKLAKK